MDHSGFSFLKNQNLSELPVDLVISEKHKLSGWEESDFYDFLQVRNLNFTNITMPNSTLHNVIHVSK